uniref:Divinyl chlorophyllide a 8-vinyl-reductase, chloroplastic n=1 Tax=Tetradesmus obliquus TaxID=3088 RepID=A0A383VRI4_TETOB|eukprot:jgi/Sobl393_1/14441/SZX67500.1
MLSQQSTRSLRSCREHASGRAATKLVRVQAFKPASTAAAASRSSSSPVVQLHRQQQLPVVSSRQSSVAVHASSSSAVAASQAYRSKPANQVNVLVVGPTGYIGRFVTKELIARGYNVIAFAREQAGIKGKMGKEDTKKELPGAQVVFGDVTNLQSLRDTAFAQPVDVVVSCLASRTGGKKDSWAIDYQATKNVLDVARERGASHFVLLSAICVQKPLLEFQRAKLQLEADLQAAGDISYSIVRPTAFFKSLAGQVELVKQGKPYVMFGDGNLASCKPISEQDLARFMADCITDADKANAVLPIGGPGKALSAKEQADILFRLTGLPPKYFPVPIALMDGIIGIFDFLAKIFPALEDSAEFGKIGRYYAAESMLVWDEKRGVYDADATPSYGTDTLEGFFQKALAEGLKGQELGDQAVFGVGE